MVDDHRPQTRRTDPRGVCLRYARCVTSEGVEARPLFLRRGRLEGAARPDMITLSLRDHLIFPGLVNAHDHLHLNSIPRLPHAAPFPNSYAWMDAFQPFMDAPAVRAARAVSLEARLRHGALKNLLCGVTTVAHHDPWHPCFELPDFPVRVLRRFGWSHSLGLGRPDSVRSRLRYGPSIRESFCAASPDMPWIVHLAEGADEAAASELDELDRLGCLAANTVLVHGVGLTARDIDRVIAAGAAVIWCPGSNLEMLGQTLDPHRLAAQGRLALGTDSRLTARGDLLSELRLASAHSALTPPELLALVTEAGSRLLRLPEAGGLQPGQCADLLIVRDSGEDPYQTLLTLERRDIRAVIRDGRPAIADPDFAEWFAMADIPTASIRLDGAAKLCAADLLGRPDQSVPEPGLERAA